MFMKMLKYVIKIGTYEGIGNVLNESSKRLKERVRGTF